MSFSSNFTRAGVRDYEKSRYRGIDQRIVHRRETKLIREMLAVAAAEEASGSGRTRPFRPPARPVRGSGRIVLDLPCGYGRFTPILKESGFDVVSADLSFEMARRAAESAAAGPADSTGKADDLHLPPHSARSEPGPGTRLPAVAANAARLPFKTGVFDLVFSIRFFHHVHDPADRAAILGEFRRASAGYVLASFYRMNGLHVLQRRLRRLFGKSRTNIKMVEPGIFEKTAEAAGFDIVRVVPLFRGLHAYHLILMKKRDAKI